MSDLRTKLDQLSIKADKAVEIAGGGYALTALSSNTWVDTLSYWSSVTVNVTGAIAGILTVYLLLKKIRKKDEPKI